MTPVTSTPDDAARAEAAVKKLRRTAFVVLAGLLAIFLLLLWALDRKTQETARKTAAQTVAKAGINLAQQLDKACDDPALRAKYPVLCDRAKQVAAASPGAAGAQGLPGPPGPSGANGRPPTTAEINQAVTLYCAAHAGCAGTPSQAQVLAAVTAYCAGDRCRGPQGSQGATGSPGAAVTGPPGPSGASGGPGPSGPPGATVTGPAGPPGPGPTVQQIADAVAAWCSAHGGCAGPAGPSGEAGPAGPPGPTGPTGNGILTVQCTGGPHNITFTITYTDGTTQTVRCA